MLENIRIVLVETSHPGNIGAAARAMKTMNLSRLHLVRPKIFPDAVATARASGADDILFNATVHETLLQAVADCHLVIGASVRTRSIKWPEWNPRQAAKKAFQAARGYQVAVVFGREHAGLTNGELDLCQYLLKIPANAEYSSLNVAAAVQIITYELNIAAKEKPEDMKASFLSSVTGGEMESYFSRLEQCLGNIDFVNPETSPRHMARLMRRLRKLYARACIDEEELNILQGIVTAVNNKLNQKDKNNV